MARVEKEADQNREITRILIRLNYNRCLADKIIRDYAYYESGELVVSPGFEGGFNEDMTKAGITDKNLVQNLTVLDMTMNSVNSTAWFCNLTLLNMDIDREKATSETFKTNILPAVVSIQETIVLTATKIKEIYNLEEEYDPDICEFARNIEVVPRN